MRESSKKYVKGILAVASAFMLIVFFIPTRQTSTRTLMGAKTAATIYNGEKISMLDENGYKSEWAEDVRLYANSGEPPERYPLAVYLLGRGVAGAIAQDPKTFMLLVAEARHAGIDVSNDQFQSVLKDVVVNMPDPGDDEYDLSLQSVRDLLLVRNLLNGVGDAVKISKPRSLFTLAMSQQDVSLSVVEIPLELYLNSAPAPTTQAVESQFERFSETLPGQTQPGPNNAVVSPLGFGYKFPNRVKIQFIGFTRDQVLDAVKRSKSAIDWEVAARQTYRKNTADFVPGTTAPDWYSLSSTVTDKVYDRVYGAAEADLSRKINVRLIEQLSGDWEAYHDAVSRGEKPPRSSQGVPLNSNDYFRLFAASLQRDFGLIPVLEIDDNGLKGPAELAQLKWIGSATDENGRPLNLCATMMGDQFTSAAQLPASQRLSLWQPSQPFFTETGGVADGVYVFRLAAMDPSHNATLDEVHDQVERDVRIQAAWDQAETEADNVLHKARDVGLLAAVRGHVPPLPVTTTDYFNGLKTNGVIPGLTLKPESVPKVTLQAMELLQTTTTDNSKPDAEVDLPADHEFAVIELHGALALWKNQAEQQWKQTQISIETEREMAQNVETDWARFDATAKRTNFQDLSKNNP